MTTTLPTLYQQFYVYTHFDPITGEIRYVGAGSKGRAWVCYGGGDGKEGSRTNEHAKWMNSLIDLGYTPDEFVMIILKNETRKVALAFERKEIVRLKAHGCVLFNRTYGLKIASLSAMRLAQAKHLRSIGLSYKDVATNVKSSTMTIWRALNGKTKAYVI